MKISNQKYYICGGWYTITELKKLVSEKEELEKTYIKLRK